MDVLLFLLFLGLVALVSVLLDRRWQRQALARQAAPPGGQPPPALAHNGENNTLLEQLKVGWQRRMGWHSQPLAESSKLRTWLLTQLADHQAVAQWVAGLTEAELDTLYQQLQVVCAAWRIDLTWLGEPPLTQDPILQRAVETIVLHYVQAQHQAMQVQAELQAFKIYLALEQRPYSYEHQPLIQQLYTHLVKAGLAAPARPEALLATEKVRIEHMLRAIQSAAAADRPAFYRVVNAVSNPLPHNGAAPPAPVAASSSQSATASAA